MPGRLGYPTFNMTRIQRLVRFASSVSQPAWEIKHQLKFPGSVSTEFTEKFGFVDPKNFEPLKTYRLTELDGTILDKSYEIPFSNDQLIHMYKNMVLVQVLDSIMYDAQRQGRLSFYMVSAGEEGIAVGSSAALESQDHIFCQYREQGALIQRGFTLHEIMAQLYHTHEDPGKGRQMPVHYGSEKLNVHPISSPLTSQLPHAAGAAYALKLSGINGIAICYFGEGAASEGDFHAALNIAATRASPVVFFCRNNGYAISTPTLDQYRGDGIASRGLGYGIPTIRVDGNDLLAVHRVTAEARELALAEKRPVLIEAMSYRVSHHSTSDDSFTYRSKVEVENWKRYDNPVSRFRRFLENSNLWNEELEQAERKHAKKAILKEMSAAEKQLKPEISSLFSDVFVELTEPLKEQKNELKTLLEKYPDVYDTSHYKGGADSL